MRNVMDMLLVLMSSVVEAPTALLPPAPALTLHGKPILSTWTVHLF
jgi:hypothetical protein